MNEVSAVLAAVTFEPPMSDICATYARPMGDLWATYGRPLGKMRHDVPNDE